MAQILPEFIPILAAPFTPFSRRSQSLTHLSYPPQIAQLALRFFTRRLWAPTLRDQIVRLRIEVKAQFVFHICLRVGAE